ncbi:SMC family ATPase [Arcanobacterium haemolyticum]|nr:SMC family ATPase [Arcanobacterium haemolyticum]
MKLHYLALEGIGPFGGAHSIDFDTLSASGIFLLDGPTGSGKTTVIDAITWALYGSVAGGEDSTDERIRSTHADPARESFVDLVFTVDSGTYRIRRTPSWIKRGNKNPTNPTAKLWKLHEGALSSHDFDDGDILENKVAGASTEIANLIGLKRNQFVQTIVLPQGKFAQFLKLTSRNRTELLEHIFDTTEYRKLADELHRRAASSGALVHDKQQEFFTSVSTLLGSLNEDETTALPHVREISLPEQGEPLIAELVKLIHDRHRALDVAHLEYEQAEQEASSAESAYEHDKKLDELLARRSELLATRAGLLARQSAHETNLEKEARHHAALELRAYLENVQSSETRLHTLRSTAEFPNIESTSSALIHDLDNKLSEFRENGGRSRNLLAHEQRITELDNELAINLAQRETLNAERSALTSRIDEAPTRISSKENELNEAQTLALTEDNLANRERNLRATLESTRELHEIRSAIATLEQRTEPLSSALQASLKHLSDVTASWIASSAALLAEDLTEGEPCPVCGSTAHPHPAPASDVTATRADFDTASAHVEDARNALNNHRSQLDKLRTREESLAAQSGDLDELNSELDDIAAKLTAARQAHATIPVLREELAALTSDLQADRTAREHLDSRLAAINATITTSSAHIATEKEELARELGTFSNATELIADLEHTISQTEQELGSRRAYLSTREAYAGAVQHLEDALSHSPFTTATEVSEALLTEEENALLHEEITTYIRDTHRIDDALAAPEIAQLTGKETTRTAELLSAAHLAKERATTAHAHEIRTRTVLEQATGFLSDVQRTHHSWKVACEKTGPLARLADLAAGGTSSLTKVPLTTYVLQQRFDNVVARANENLARISLGRYELERTDEKEKSSREQRTGLGLVVVDHLGDPDGDIRRSTRSLSGGESFYVSLSLALALADVVQSENGGIQLDTLLIDEGFGTLDSDTLDHVMQVLTNLAEGGRTVGIVSHVEELRSMIPERISVSPQPDGSSTLHVTA